MFSRSKGRGGLGLAFSCPKPGRWLLVCQAGPEITCIDDL